MKIRCFAGPFNGLWAEVAEAGDNTRGYRVTLHDLEECYELGRDGMGGMLLTYAPERRSEADPRAAHIV